MNILILNWRDPKNPKSGGAEIVTMEHAKAWIAKGHSVTWFTSQFSNCKKQEIINGVKIVREGNSYSTYFWALPFYFKNRKNIDFIVDEVHGIPYFTPLYAKKRKIILVHEVAGEIWNHMYSFPLNLIGKLMEKSYLWLYKNKNFWTDAESTKKELLTYGIKPKNCTVINCGIKNKILEKLPKKEKDPTFIFVSRVVKMKGIEDVIAAFFRIAKVKKQAKLWIVGDGDLNYVNKLKLLVKNYGFENKIIFFGKVNEEKKLELMRKAHLLLHASVKEGWGLVVAEAASQATPSVVYNVNGLRDSVINNKTGIVIGKNNPDEMAKSVIKLINSKKEYLNMQNKSLEWASELSWEKATSQSIALLEDVNRS